MQFHRESIYNCFEKQAKLNYRLDIEMHREGYYYGEARLKGDSVSGETTEGLFIQRSL